LLGLGFSFQLDVPASPVIILFLAVALAIAGSVKGIQKWKREKKAA
jgi:hypothetical protein